ncbi:hypothetical protein [Pseudonocardia parietis]|uniref:Uncharacterized protein n=1 Tax=Pseudonocardia parietis TaxID=570936 RepID=A0ABS4W2F3_9PSEU|nr:hypothetical protein [Pseudonocardia parietis]MBP2370293.1 hypothetical protein [Pseudonocardia parietis]
MTAPHRAGHIDYACLHADLLPVLERHGVLAPGETLDGWVGVLRFCGVHPDGREYRRDEALTGPGVTLGEAAELYATGARLMLPN